MKTIRSNFFPVGRTILDSGRSVRGLAGSRVHLDREAHYAGRDWIESFPAPGPREILRKLFSHR